MAVTGALSDLRVSLLKNQGEKQYSQGEKQYSSRKKFPDHQGEEEATYL